RARKWYREGFLCIGDAAHAMSPIGGVGINLAIQDAVASANLLTPALRRGPPTIDPLRKVQRRREWPTRFTQRVQVAAQARIVSRVLENRGNIEVPLVLRLLARFPVLRRIPARLIGLGVRPEHVEVRREDGARRSLVD
ncbi:MAG: FAD-dependent monooxygenase, partial [Gammaproteobacteria bacterium]